MHQRLKASQALPFPRHILHKYLRNQCGRACSEWRAAAGRGTVQRHIFARAPCTAPAKDANDNQLTSFLSESISESIRVSLLVSSAPAFLNLLFSMSGPQLRNRWVLHAAAQTDESATSKAQRLRGQQTATQQCLSPKLFVMHTYNASNAPDAQMRLKPVLRVRGSGTEDTALVRSEAECGGFGCVSPM